MAFPLQEPAPLKKRSQKQLATEKIRDLIRRGRFSGEGYLPSIRKTAELIGLNRDATWRAYSDLESEGYIQSSKNRRYKIHSALLITHLRTLNARLLTVGENSIRFSGLQRFHKTLVDNESLFGIRTHLKCAIDANEVSPDWLKGMDCLIVGGYFDNSSLFDSLFSNIPTIGVITSLDWHPGVSIDSDNLQMGRLAAKRLLENGSKNPCLISYSELGARHMLRKLGFQSEWIENGRSIDKFSEYSINPDNTYKRVTELERIARNLGDHDAVFCLDKESAIDLLNILEHLNISVPRDLKVISVDGTFDGLKTRPSLTYVRQRFEQMAAFAAEQMRLLCSESPPLNSKNNKLLVPGDIVLRESA